MSLFWTKKCVENKIENLFFSLQPSFSSWYHNNQWKMGQNDGNIWEQWDSSSHKVDTEAYYYFYNHILNLYFLYHHETWCLNCRKNDSKFYDEFSWANPLVTRSIRSLLERILPTKANESIMVFIFFFK